MASTPWFPIQLLLIALMAMVVSSTQFFEQNNIGLPDFENCLPSFSKLGGCADEISHALGVLSTGGILPGLIGPACCDAVSEMHKHCWIHIFPDLIYLKVQICCSIHKKPPLPPPPSDPVPPVAPQLPPPSPTPVDPPSPVAPAPVNPPSPPPQVPVTPGPVAPSPQDPPSPPSQDLPVAPAPQERPCRPCPPCTPPPPPRTRPACETPPPTPCGCC